MRVASSRPRAWHLGTESPPSRCAGGPWWWALPPWASCTSLVHPPRIDHLLLLLLLVLLLHLTSPSSPLVSLIIFLRLASLRQSFLSALDRPLQLAARQQPLALVPDTTRPDYPPPPQGGILVTRKDLALT